MRIASAISTLESAPAAAQDIEAQIKSQLPTSPDLLLLFVSQHAASFESLGRMIRSALVPAEMIAVSAESVIGVDQEVERTAGVSAFAISLGGADASIKSFYISEDQWQEILTEEESLREQVGAENLRALAMFADPFTTPIVQLLDACTAAFPNAPVLGGMASGMKGPGEARLMVNDDLHSSGVVGVSFAGNIEIDCVVSQGCRPIGETLVVTQSQKNIVEQLDGKPAMLAIEEMIEKLPLHDKQLVATGGLQIGSVIDEGKGNYGPGDFLVRPLIGVRRESGAILIGDMVRTGQTMQFHVRDAKTADQEMRLLLEGEALLAETNPPIGALLITCNGRGTRMFDMPHHDISLSRQVLGSIPIAGFFAAGELGPVGQKNFIHGHTAALAIFRQTSPT